MKIFTVIEKVTVVFEVHAYNEDEAKTIVIAGLGKIMSEDVDERYVAGGATAQAFYRPADGHTYWRDKEGAWVGAPTMGDGEVDPDEAGSIADFDLEIHDIAALNAELNALEQAATDRGHQA